MSVKSDDQRRSWGVLGGRLVTGTKIKANSGLEIILKKSESEFRS